MTEDEVRRVMRQELWRDRKRPVLYFSSTLNWEQRKEKIEQAQAEFDAETVRGEWIKGCPL